MKTFVFMPSGNDELDDDEPTIDDLVKLVKLHNLVGKTRSKDQGALLRHTFDNMTQSLQKSESYDDEMATWIMPGPDEEEEEWPYDKQTKAVMNNPPVRSRMTS